MKKNSENTFENEDPREKWLQHLRHSRRVYSFQKWVDERKQRKISFSEITTWIVDDIRHFIVSNINIMMQLRNFGGVIKDAYGLTYFQQWYRMVYLAFVMRTSSTRFRFHHHFDNERWIHVKNLPYGRHIQVHNKVLGYPHHDELKILADKFEFFEFCKTKGLQTPEILSVFKNGMVTFPSNGIFKIPKSDLFVKELTGGMGVGARKFTYKNGGFHDRDGKIYRGSELQNFLVDYSKKTNDLIVQPAKKNHDSWKKFTSGGLATCRIATGISPSDTAEIIPFFAVMKMPTGNIDADNYSKGSVLASVDISSGVMTSGITFKPINGKFTFDIHPDTGNKIKGKVLPFWDEMIEFIKNVHRNFKTIAIGWDVSFTEEGLTVVEGNVEWGSDLLEAPANRPIADTIYMEWFDGWARRMHGKEVVPFDLPWYKL